MLSFVSILYAALALFVARTTAYSQRDNKCCDNVVCLTSLVFCGLDKSCDFGKNEYSISSDLNRATGYGVLGLYETYDITWKNADPHYPVNITWTFGTYDTTQVY